MWVTQLINTLYFVGPYCLAFVGIFALSALCALAMGYALNLLNGGDK